MKRTLQRFQITVPAATANENGSFVLNNAKMLESYARVTHVFVVNETTVNLGNTYSNLIIGGVEVLPKDTKLSIIQYNGNFSPKDSGWDFANDKIPARSSDVIMEFDNADTQPVSFSVYFTLEND
ncbi:MAG: hypothetical protein LBS50_11000 [Prevotellaceae bacterium]|nr:hypothetical protein [Prevotellaceae bacterium]